ncbi:MAG: hypothetical protein RL213_1098 [Bacteroidota bacterium]|jgi:hypothetical protein
MKKTITLHLVFLLASVSVFGQWTSLGSGLPGRVKAITVFNGKIYAGGAFSTLKNVAVFNEANSTWSIAGDGLSDSVTCLAVHGGSLYAGGYFKFNGSGDSLMYVAKLNAINKWERVYTGFNNFLRCLYSDGTTLYAGGSFNNSPVSGGTVSRIAKLGTTGWTSVGNSASISGTVAAITTFSSQLYAAGSFSGNLLARFNGASWDIINLSSSIGGSEISALAPKGTKLYLGGNFNGTFMKGLAVFNGTSAAPPFTSLYDGTTQALLSTNFKIFGGGSFTKNTNQQNLRHFFSSSGTTPFDEVGGFNGDVLSLANQNGKIVVGGSFTTAGGASATNIARSSATIDVNEIESTVTEAVLYPNPVTESSTVHFSTVIPVKEAILRIINVEGKTVSELLPLETGNPLRLEFLISREGLPAGSYFYSLLGEGEALSNGKFIVE